MERRTPRITEHGPMEQTDTASHPVVMALGIVMLIALFALGAAGLGNTLGSEDVGDIEIVIVPRGQGRPAEVVQRQMERLGLFVEITYESNETAPPDTVTGQTPIAGSRIEVGKLVVLTVSDGPAGIRVPDVAGLQRMAAANLLSAVGLESTADEIFDDDVRAGEVVSTEPEEGTRVQLGSHVVIHLSKGPRPRVVPDVVGLSAPEAFALIGVGELQIGRISRRSARDVAPGSIVSTNPAAGAEVPRSTPIDLVITPEPTDVTIPDLVRMTPSAASRVASATGVRLSTRTLSVPAGDQRSGIVVSQNPIAGSIREPGTTVEVTVAVAPEPPPVAERPPDDERPGD